MGNSQIFLDTNKVIDLIQRRKKDFSFKTLKGCTIYISPLSVHILSYVAKYKIPNKNLTKLVGDYFYIINFDEYILELALKGPTKDLEDNIQLHSAVQAECNLFLTDDKELLKIGEFNRVKISNQI